MNDLVQALGENRFNLDFVLVGKEFLTVGHIETAARRERPRQARQRGK